MFGGDNKIFSEYLFIGNSNEKEEKDREWKNANMTLHNLIK